MKTWIEQALREPDIVEDKGARRSFFKRLPDRRIMLRVVTPIGDPEYVTTAYFDRGKPCA